MSQNERQQRFVERILEDERLRGDLEDAAATALVNWATTRVEAAAADPARPDAAVEAEVQAVRSAARSAARSGESNPRRLIALAEAALTRGTSGAAAPPPGTPATAASPAPQEPAAAPASSASQQAVTPTLPAATPATSASSVTQEAPATTPERAREHPGARPSARHWQRFVSWLTGKRQERR